MVKLISPPPEAGGGRVEPVECSITTRFDELIADIFNMSINCSASIIFATPLKKSLPLCDWEPCHGTLFFAATKKKRALDGVREFPESYQFCISLNGEVVCADLHTDSYVQAFRRAVNYFTAQSLYRAGLASPMAPISAFNAFVALFTDVRGLPVESFRYLVKRQPPLEALSI